MYDYAACRVHGLRWESKALLTFLYLRTAVLTEYNRRNVSDKVYIQ